MDKLTFYHQQRQDGGLRSGVEFNDERILERYEPGAIPRDSALAWFVDVRCRGEGLPAAAEEVREWFLGRSGVIQAALRQLAQELGTGIDSDWPLKRPIPAIDGNDMAIYCSAIRRLSGREIAAVLTDLATRWPALVRELPNYSSPVPANA